MKNLPKVLNHILTARKKEFTAATFAAAAGVNAGDLSRLRKQDKEPTPEFFERLVSCPLLAPQEAQQLIVAHLRDVVPAIHKDAILIRLTDPTGTAGESSDLLVETLEYCRNRARTDPEFYTWFTGIFTTVVKK